LGDMSFRIGRIRFRWSGFAGWIGLRRAREGGIAFTRCIWPPATCTVFLVVVLSRCGVARELVSGSSVESVVERFGRTLGDNGRMRAWPSTSLHSNYDSLGIDWEWVLRFLCHIGLL